MPSPRLDGEDFSDVEQEVENATIDAKVIEAGRVFCLEVRLKMVPPFFSPNVKCWELRRDRPSLASLSAAMAPIGVS